MKNIYRKIYLILLSAILLLNMANAQEKDTTVLDFHTFVKNAKNKNYWDMQKEIKSNPAIIEKWHEKEIKKYNRFTRFWDSRLDSSGDYTKWIKGMDAFYRAHYPDNKATVASAGQLSLNSVETEIDNMALMSSAYTWEQVGLTTDPDGFFDQSGRGMIRSIWVDPDDFNTILIGASSGGLWKTTNGGVNWTCLTDDYMLGGVTDIVVNPSNKNNIYITTRMGGRESLHLSGNYSLGIFCTMDGGNYWYRQESGLPLHEVYQKIWMDPDNPSILIAISTTSVYKTTNGGVAWTRLNFNLPYDVFPQALSALLVHPDNHNIMYIGGWNLFFRTTDGGANWTNLGYPLYVESLFENFDLDICINPNNSSEYFINFWDRFGTPVCNPNRIARSTDGLYFNVINSQSNICSYGSQIIRVSPNGKIFAGGYFFNRSDNNGISFSNINYDQLHPDIRDICFPDPSNGDLVYIVNDGGVCKSTDAGRHWTRIDGNLSTNEFYDLAIYEPDREIMLSGSHDCGTYYRKSNGVWYHIHDGDGGRSMIDYSNPNTVYVTATYAGLYRHDAITRSNSKKLCDFYYDAPVFMHQSNPNIIYKAYTGHQDYRDVYMSQNKGGTWTQFDHTSHSIRDFAMCKYHPEYLYYVAYIDWDGANDNEIKKCVDHSCSGMTYNGLESLISTPLNDIWVSPCDPDHVIVSFGGFNYNQNIFQYNKTNNRWDNISGNGLPVELPVHCYERFGDIEFAGTDVGLYSRSDGTNWEWCSGMPRCIISDIKVNNLYGDVVVSTYGRGIYRTKLLEGCYDGSTVSIWGPLTFDRPKVFCSNYRINSGGALTIASQVVFANEATITVKSGGVLTIDGGVLINVNINVESGGRLNVMNDGRIVLNNYDNLVINTGAIYEAGEGKITVRYTH